MDVYANITNRIIELLDQGVIPWHKPWNGVSARNFVSDQSYRGMNTILLNAAPYASPYWLTFNQAKAHGGHVRKGQHGWPIVFFERVVKTNDAGEVEKAYPLLRGWTVFNLEQCEGLESPAHPVPEFKPIEIAEKMIADMPSQPPIHHDGKDEAFYRPRTDSVHMPVRESFETPEGYYSVLFHEVAHSTGHPKRLARPDVMLPTFGSTPYAKEELVAEMTAAMLCGVSGISPKTVHNNAAYIANWLTVFKSDRKILIQAAAAAQKAADYIRGVTPPDGQIN